mmetsp:Transcript_3458/g.4647  ORF Transcript_3458/g.4647 Transcript_3458/m.4647 type:complete len:80 (+) Transcript_3458:713-952(+)
MTGSKNRYSKQTDRKVSATPIDTLVNVGIKVSHALSFQISLPWKNRLQTNAYTGTIYFATRLTTQRHLVIKIDGSPRIL